MVNKKLIKLLLITTGGVVLIGYQGRRWALSDLNKPNYSEEACVSLLFNSSDIDSGYAAYESLASTSIYKKFNGLIETKAHTFPIMGVRYIKISAPKKNIEKITVFTRALLAKSFPDLKPEYSFSYPPKKP